MMTTPVGRRQVGVIWYVEDIKVEGACTALLSTPLIENEWKHSLGHETETALKVQVQSPSITSALSDHSRLCVLFVLWFESKVCAAFPDSTAAQRKVQDNVHKRPVVFQISMFWDEAAASLMSHKKTLLPLENK